MHGTVVEDSFSAFPCKLTSNFLIRLSVAIFLVVASCSRLSEVPKGSPFLAGEVQTKKPFHQRKTRKLIGDESDEMHQQSTTSNSSTVYCRLEFPQLKHWLFKCWISHNQQTCFLDYYHPPMQNFLIQELLERDGNLQCLRRILLFPPF